MDFKQAFFGWVLGVSALILAVSVQATETDDKSVKPEEAPKVAAGIRVSDAYIRVPVPGRDITAAFFSVRNTTRQPVALVSVHADFAERTELHSHSHSDGMMRMRKEDKVVIPANGSLQFAPGGYHVMLFDLQRTIQTGDQLQLRLEFADGSQLLVPAGVRSAFDHAHH